MSLAEDIREVAKDISHSVGGAVSSVQNVYPLKDVGVDFRAPIGNLGVQISELFIPEIINREERLQGVSRDLYKLQILGERSNKELVALSEDQKSLIARGYTAEAEAFTPATKSFFNAINGFVAKTQSAGWSNKMEKGTNQLTMYGSRLLALPYAEWSGRDQFVKIGRFQDEEWYARTLKEFFKSADASGVQDVIERQAVPVIYVHPEDVKRLFQDPEVVRKIGKEWEFKNPYQQVFKATRDPHESLHSFQTALLRVTENVKQGTAVFDPRSLGPTQIDFDTDLLGLWVAGMRNLVKNTKQFQSHLMHCIEDMRNMSTGAKYNIAEYQAIKVYYADRLDNLMGMPQTLKNIGQNDLANQVDSMLKQDMKDFAGLSIETLQKQDKTLPAILRNTKASYKDLDISIENIEHNIFSNIRNIPDPTKRAFAQFAVSTRMLGDISKDTAAIPGVISAIDGIPSKLEDLGQRFARLVTERATSKWDTSIAATNVSLLHNQLHGANTLIKDSISMLNRLDSGQRLAQFGGMNVQPFKRLVYNALYSGELSQAERETVYDTVAAITMVIEDIGIKALKTKSVGDRLNAFEMRSLFAPIMVGGKVKAADVVGILKEIFPTTEFKSGDLDLSRITILNPFKSILALDDKLMGPALELLLARFSISSQDAFHAWNNINRTEEIVAQALSEGILRKTTVADKSAILNKNIKNTFSNTPALVQGVADKEARYRIDENFKTVLTQLRANDQTQLIDRHIVQLGEDIQFPVQLIEAMDKAKNLTADEIAKLKGNVRLTESAFRKEMSKAGSVAGVAIKDWEMNVPVDEVLRAVRQTTGRGALDPYAQGLFNYKGGEYRIPYFIWENGGTHILTLEDYIVARAKTGASAAVIMNELTETLTGGTEAFISQRIGMPTPIVFLQGPKMEYISEAVFKKMSLNQQKEYVLKTLLPAYARVGIAPASAAGSPNVWKPYGIATRNNILGQIVDVVLGRSARGGVNTKYEIQEQTSAFNIWETKFTQEHYWDNFSRFMYNVFGKEAWNYAGIPPSGEGAFPIFPKMFVSTSTPSAGGGFMASSHFLKFMSADTEMNRLVFDTELDKARGIAMFDEIWNVYGDLLKQPNKLSKDAIYLEHLGTNEQGNVAQIVLNLGKLQRELGEKPLAGLAQWQKELVSEKLAMPHTQRILDMFPDNLKFQIKLTSAGVRDSKFAQLREGMDPRLLLELVHAFRGKTGGVEITPMVAVPSQVKIIGTFAGKGAAQILDEASTDVLSALNRYEADIYGAFGSVHMDSFVRDIGHTTRQFIMEGVPEYKKLQTRQFAEVSKNHVEEFIRLSKEIDDIVAKHGDHPTEKGLETMINELRGVYNKALNLPHKSEDRVALGQFLNKFLAIDKNGKAEGWLLYTESVAAHPYNRAPGRITVSMNDIRTMFGEISELQAYIDPGGMETKRTIAMSSFLHQIAKPITKETIASSLGDFYADATWVSANQLWKRTEEGGEVQLETVRKFAETLKKRGKNTVVLGGGFEKTKAIVNAFIDEGVDAVGAFTEEHAEALGPKMVAIGKQLAPTVKTERAFRNQIMANLGRQEQATVSRLAGPDFTATATWFGIINEVDHLDTGTKLPSLAEAAEDLLNRARTQGSVGNFLDLIISEGQAIATQAGHDAGAVDYAQGLWKSIPSKAKWIIGGIGALVLGIGGLNKLSFHLMDKEGGQEDKRLDRLIREESGYDRIPPARASLPRTSNNRPLMSRPVSHVIINEEESIDQERLRQYLVEHMQTGRTYIK